MCELVTKNTAVFSLSRVGQWKFTDNGVCTCIAEGGGYVMVRNRGRSPWCYAKDLWDEMCDAVPDEGMKLKSTTPHQ